MAIQRDVHVPTSEGTCPASLHLPDGAGPWPAVIIYPDAGGLREVMRDMGRRLAALGYVTLVPDVYYRHGQWAPFDMGTAFTDPGERGRITGMAAGVSVTMIDRDAEALVSYLDSLPETRPGGVGVTGYCMGGRMALLAAAKLGERATAVASFHGGNLAKADDPDSPHHRAGAIRARVYVVGATDDPSFPDEQRHLLQASLAAAGVVHTIETYAARHGFTVSDTPAYDPAAAERHWTTLERFFADALAR